MLDRYSLRKSGEMYLISIIGQTREVDLNSPPLSIEERLEIRIGQASKDSETSPEELRKLLEKGVTIYWK